MSFTAVALLALLVFSSNVGCSRRLSETTREDPVDDNVQKSKLVIKATVGQLMILPFSYLNFAGIGNITRQERLNVPVRKQKLSYQYSASAFGKPDLPSWIYLAQAPINSDLNQGFLYGTPGIESSDDEIMILARNLETNQVFREIVRVDINRNSNFTAPMKSIAEIWVRNLDVWEVLASWARREKKNLLHRLRTAIYKAFRYPGAKGETELRPYLRDLKPAVHAGGRISLTSDKVGFVAYIGTAQGFTAGIQNWAIGFANHQDRCNQTDAIPSNAYFEPTFDVDWCRFRIYNTTERGNEETAMLVDGHSIKTRPSDRNGNFGRRFRDFDSDTAMGEHQVYHYEPVSRTRDYSWEWVTLAIVPLAILLLLVLALSAVFFGCREGQHWRDYKTPQQKLSEYVNLRRTQDRLRMLSDKRQSVDILETSSPPEQHRSAPSSPVLSLGKQTVAEAAAVKGSELDLYKDSDSLIQERLRRRISGHYEGDDDQRAYTMPQRQSSNDEHRMLLERDSSV